MSGWVYVLANGMIPFHYKIGMTRLHPDERARQLSAPSGVPSDFDVLCAVMVPDPVALERAAHARYRLVRPNARREFFVFTARPELLELCDWLVDSAEVIELIKHEDFDYWVGLLPPRREARLA